jgi:hypothetical protein
MKVKTQVKAGLFNANVGVGQNAAGLATIQAIGIGVVSVL